MKQVFQNLSSGEITIENIPVPNVQVGYLLVATTRTLISSGTERMLLEFGRAGPLGKIKQQPNRVKEVFEKIKTDGLLTTLESVKSKLDQPIPLGYSHVGRVLDAGGVPDFKIGDRVLSNGAHAEVVRVPKTLCVKIPDSVDDESAVFTVVGSIALQGIRLLNPTLGECVVVQGLGLVGLIAVQLLIAAGCRVLGADFDPHKLALAKQFGAETVDLSAGEDLVQKADYFSRGRGVDAVLITASAKEDTILHQAATISRKRGRIVLVGVVDLNLRREDFYEKELNFQVSCSYGPGRYDESYESKGQDYPIGFVRWTEQRNFEAVLDMMAAGKLDVKPMISAYFPVTEAKEAYDALTNKNNLGLVFKYSDNQDVKLERTVELQSAKINASKVNLAFVGAGNYASRVLMPAFKRTNALLNTVITSQGASAVIHGKKQGFEKAGTDIDSVLENKSINTIVIATQHHLHAKQTLAALESGKHVFVEKPLCINLNELDQLKKTYYALQAAPLLMVGFNRRFSPYTQKIKSLIAPLNVPMHLVMTVNAGMIPKSHWAQNPALGGGRLVGEACHYVDLLRYLVGKSIIHADVISLAKLSEGTPEDENFTISLTFLDGSCGTIHYFANGHKKIPKERLEIFIANKVLQLDNFRKLTACGFKKFKKMRSMRIDKGQNACPNVFVQAIESGNASPIPVAELFEVAEICIALRDKIIKKTSVAEGVLC